jgi:hypothetical protein
MAVVRTQDQPKEDEMDRAHGMYSGEEKYTQSSGEEA